MELPDLKKLKALVALCRKQGISTIEIGGLKLTLAEPKPTPAPAKKNPSPAPDNRPSNYDTDGEPDPETLLFWSSGGPQQ